ncbi:DUF1565 domain-containing protein [Salmonirosea aquatica]|uniref:DUF1565 domain-containing protein n=1 Tax=Salmonirosea aquatica TaxID=2654236 RepID=UPI00357117AA
MKNDLLFPIRKTYTYLRAMLLVISLLILASPSFATIRYVDDARPDNNGDGLSWGTAFKDLKLAISVAQAGDEIWVAQGTYKPTTNPAQNGASFSMKEGVAIYGGFTSGQANRNDRNPDPATNNTLLSGDIDNDGLPTGNSRTVVYNNSSLTTAAILDGFTITHGNSNAASGGECTMKTVVQRLSIAGLSAIQRKLAGACTIRLPPEMSVVRRWSTVLFRTTQPALAEAYTTMAELVPVAPR